MMTIFFMSLNDKPTHDLLGNPLAILCVRLLLFGTIEAPKCLYGTALTGFLNIFKQNWNKTKWKTFWIEETELKNRFLLQSKRTIWALKPLHPRTENKQHSHIKPKKHEAWAWKPGAESWQISRCRLVLRTQHITPTSGPFCFAIKIGSSSSTFSGHERWMNWNLWIMSPKYSNQRSEFMGHSLYLSFCQFVCLLVCLSVYQ